MYPEASSRLRLMRTKSMKKSVKSTKNTGADIPKDTTTDAVSKTTAELQATITQLQEELVAAQESEKRALADYQNVVRRNQQERAAFAKFATKDLMQSLLEPLTHLDLASKQIDDPGLNMVIEQFWNKLQEAGLQKEDVIGKEFDVELMEAADTKGSGKVVVSVHRPAFTYNGEVIQHARVVMGDA